MQMHDRDHQKCRSCSAPRAARPRTHHVYVVHVWRTAAAVIHERRTLSPSHTGMRRYIPGRNDRSAVVAGAGRPQLRAVYELAGRPFHSTTLLRNHGNAHESVGRALKTSASLNVVRKQNASETRRMRRVAVLGLNSYGYVVDLSQDHSTMRVQKMQTARGRDAAERCLRTLTLARLSLKQRALQAACTEFARASASPSQVHSA